MTNYPWISEFKIIQERLDRIVLRIVPRAGEVAQVALLKRSVATRVGPDVDVEVEVVATIPVEPSGKFSPFRSLLRERESDVHEDNGGR
jgi:hypothetical protein